MYNIVLFAYNEELNIASSIESVFKNSDSDLANFYVLANGCSDSTVRIATREKSRLQFKNMQVIEINLGDKCNAWNTYIYDLSSDANTHFFCDADVYFSNLCFSKMHKKLSKSPANTVVVAGMPLSGRNRDFYRSLILERACFFGNLYGVKGTFVERIKSLEFRLPIGLNWIDSILTKAVNTDLQFTNSNIPDRTTWVEGCGYCFASLSLFKVRDISLYFKRIARYELGKLQEIYLDNLPYASWPRNLNEVNQMLWNDFSKRTANLSLFNKFLVRKRLQKLLYGRK